RRPRFHRERIDSAERFRTVCPTGALTVTGEQMSVAEVVREVEKDRPFYGTEGGVTLSGGEPFMQPRLAAGLIEALGESGIDTVIETSLHAPWSAIEPTLGGVSRFLADVKHVDEEKFGRSTGGALSVVTDNFRRLERVGARVTARIPVIPGFNDTRSEMRRILEFVASLSNVDETHLLAYHTLGDGKYTLLGREVLQPPTPVGQLEPFVEIAGALGLRVVIGG
ncbi:glycyl-radical enzyme activating protein, partial [Salinispira pacifica]